MHALWLQTVDIVPRELIQQSCETDSSTCRAEVTGKPAKRSLSNACLSTMQQLPRRSASVNECQLSMRREGGADDVQGKPPRFFFMACKQDSPMASELLT